MAKGAKRSAARRRGRQAPRLLRSLPKEKPLQLLPKTRMKISENAVAHARQRAARINPFVLANHPKSVFPKGASTMAMDDQINTSLSWAANAIGSIYAEGLAFLGYPDLSGMAQRAEYRKMCERIAVEMTRKWIKFQAIGEAAKAKPQEKKPEKPNPFAKKDDGEEPAAKEIAAEDDGEEVGEVDELTGKIGPFDDETEELDEGSEESGEEDELDDPKDDKSDKIKKIEEEFERLGVADAFMQIARDDGFFGRSHLYLDTGDTEDRKELMMPIGDGRSKMSQLKVSPEKPLKNLKVVEAVWCYPSRYNAVDPLRQDWYAPQEWFCQGKQIDATRLLTFIGRPVPDLLKPAYSFGGLALTQMAKPYVDNWLTTRQSVNDLIQAFSTMILMSDLAALMEGGQGDDVLKRIDIFNANRNNRGLMVVDKNTEDLKNVAVPLGTLDKLQAQAQEHMCSVSGIPLVIFTGITPSGLNASSEGEIRTFYDWIAAYQKSLFQTHLNTVFWFVQLSLFGEVDPDITYKFEELWSLDAKSEAEVQKTQAETDGVNIDNGTISPEEARKRIVDDPNSNYKGLNADEMPEPPEPDPSEMPFGGMGGFPEGEGPPGAVKQGFAGGGKNKKPGFGGKVPQPKAAKPARTVEKV